MNKKLVYYLVALVSISILYRVLPYRIDNFNPLYTIGLFSGFVFSNNKKLAFFAPLATLFLSDCLYHILYINGLNSIPGFYGYGQILQYFSMSMVSVVGFFMKNSNIASVSIFSIMGAIVFYFLSNFFVWFEGMGWENSFSFSGLIKCYRDGIPFFKATLSSSIIFSVIVFLCYNLFIEKNTVRQVIK